MLRREEELPSGWRLGRCIRRDRWELTLPGPYGSWAWAWPPQSPTMRESPFRSMGAGEEGGITWGLLFGATNEEQRPPTISTTDNPACESDDLRERAC